MVEKSDVELYFFKELQWIKDIKLKDNVIKVWLEAAKRGQWKTIDDIPFTLLIENSGKLIDHTKRITNLARVVYNQRKEKLNLDFLIAGALLHDFGKLLEYVKENRKYTKSELGKKFRHPLSGALLAKEMKLPDEVVFIIYAHSHEGDDLKRSPEAIIVNHCDFIDFELKKTMV
jgi:putative nucleotidyltransferase with HDIG domain